MRRLFTLSVLLVFASSVMAQVPVGKMPSGSVLLKGGTIHVGNGTVIEQGYVVLENGKITAVGQADATPSSAGKVIDLAGAHVYPGLILPNVDVGLGEVGAVRATIDNSEHGTFNPSVRTLTSYNTDSEIIPTLRFNGVTTVQSTPSGGTISGTSSIMALEGWNWEDAAYAADDGIHINWPAQIRTKFDWATRKRDRKPDDKYAQKVRDLEKLFNDAKAYGQQDAKARTTNLKLEALQGLFDGSKTAYLHSNSASVMVDGVLALKRFGVSRIVISGGRDALDISDFLVEHKIPVILANIHRLPRSASTDVNKPYKMPALLKKAGVDFCLGYGSRANARNLAFVAGTAAAWGLDKEDALAAITSSTARILGIDDHTGTLEAGKDANLVVSKGDLLDMRTNQLTHLFIRGKHVPLEAMQQRLYERYRQKYAN